MPKPNKQVFQILAAGTGLIAVFAFMGHLMVSGAQRHVSPSEQLSMTEAMLSRLARDRALEMRDMLDLDAEQVAKVERTLREYHYGVRPGEWRRSRGLFYSDIREILTPEQRSQLRTWDLERRHRRGLRSIIGGPSEMDDSTRPDGSVSRPTAVTSSE